MGEPHLRFRDPLSALVAQGIQSCQGLKNSPNFFLQALPFASPLRGAKGSSPLHCSLQVPIRQARKAVNYPEFDFLSTYLNLVSWQARNCCSLTSFQICFNRNMAS